MPIKAKIQSKIDFLEKKRIKGLYEDVFWLNVVLHTTEYRILKSRISRTLKNNLNRKEAKG